MLEDGKSFFGENVGVEGERIGELVFNTAVVGYQEMMTDPVYAGKILLLTYPLIGNYGCAPKFNESKGVWLAGLVIKEKSRIHSNWQAKLSFDAFVKTSDLLTIKDVDTRTLSVHLRQKGPMLGVISTRCFETRELLAKIAAFRTTKVESLLPKISIRKPVFLGAKKTKAKKIAILDVGITRSILRQLEALGASVILLPYSTPAAQILSLKPHGLIISDGPEDDAGLKEVAVHLKGLIAKLPILGIGTGHQVLAAALGAKVVKMKLGHHGVNYPIYNPRSYKGEITVQRHSHVVDTDSLNKIRDITITAYNLNDRTVEEMESKKRKCMGVQYTPASPGFNEVNSALKRFIKMLS